MTDREPSDLTPLSDILHADQADAAIVAMGNTMGRYYAVMREHGVPKSVAGQAMLTLHAMSVGQHFGLDVSEAFGVGPIYGEEG